MARPNNVTQALRLATESLPKREERVHQGKMAQAVADAIGGRRHLVVQAGTGTGKSLAYLVPAITSGSRTIVATATKNLQEQLATRDLPMLASSLRTKFFFSVLKGRSNYLCRQRIVEIQEARDQLSLIESRNPQQTSELGQEVARLVTWSEQTSTGDRAELAFEPSPLAWSQVSVGHNECPGASNCPSGQSCFSEIARRSAAAADVVVVNTHLYAAHLASGGTLLGAHDVLIVDEAHQMEDIASTSLGFQITGPRITAVARLTRGLIPKGVISLSVEESSRVLMSALGRWRGKRLTTPLAADISGALLSCRERVSALLAAVRSAQEQTPAHNRAVQACSNLVDQLNDVISIDDTQVAWVHGPEASPVLEIAPLDVGELLQKLAWSSPDAPTVVLTSATIPPGLAGRLGLERCDELDVGSPFDYENQALLYCPLHLPDPRNERYEKAMLEELTWLIEAAGGRTMALFTSRKAMQTASDHIAKVVPWTILVQDQMPKSALVEKFTKEEQSCLFATMGFWQGVDVPGPSLSMVVIDRLPFPRPDDPLLKARRERAGASAFSTIDIPRAAALLAQGAGRLIRSADDKGVVAVLDPRLGTARYRWDLISALPPMRRSRHRASVTEALQ